MTVPQTMPLPVGQIPLADCVMGDQFPRFSLATATQQVYAGDGTIAPNIPLGGGVGFNVKNFGAKGDGVTDDTAAIAAANAVLATAAGGTMYFPKGIYIVTQITVNNRVNYEGEGQGNTIVKLKDGSTTNVFQGANFATLTGTTSNSGPTQWAIRKMSIDGNKANCPSGGRGIAVYGSEFQIENLNVQDCHGDGIFLEFRGNLATKFDKYVIFEECYGRFIKVQSCDGNGVWIFGLHDSVFYGINVGFNGGNSKGDGTAGFRTENNGNHFTNCHAYGTQQDYAWNLRGHTILTSCVGEGAATSQFFCAFVDAHITGGEAYFPGSTSCTAISFSGTPLRTRITDMHISKQSSTHEFAPAIDFTGAAGQLVLKANIDQATGNAYSGSPPADALLEIMVGGGSTTPNLYQTP